MERIKEFPALVPENKVQSYLDENGIQVRRLSNGLTIIAGNRFVPDDSSANLHIWFPSGAFFDPKGKEGILHVYEHLIAIKTLTVAQKYSAEFNAHTRIDEMRITLNAIANPKIRDYGYWPVMPSIYDELTAPKIPTDERLEIEKNVVLREYAERNGNGKSQSVRIFKDNLLFGDNPQIREVDTVAGVKAITREDIEELQSRVLIAPGTNAGILTQGQPELLDVVLSDLEENLSRMSKGEREPQIFDYELCKATNPDFTPGNFYTLDDDSKDGNAEVKFVWKFQTKSFDSSKYALVELFYELGNRFFGYVREKGYGYTAGSDFNETKQKSVNGTTFSSIYLKTNPMDDKESATKKLLGELRQNVIAMLKDQELDALVHRISRPIAAIPLSISQRLADASSGLQFYGRPIDSQIIRDTLLSITKGNLKDWKDRLLDENPAFVLTGDLGKP